MNRIQRLSELNNLNNQIIENLEAQLKNCNKQIEHYNEIIKLDNILLTRVLSRADKYRQALKSMVYAIDVIENGTERNDTLALLNISSILRMEKQKITETLDDKED